LLNLMVDGGAMHGSRTARPARRPLARTLAWGVAAAVVVGCVVAALVVAIAPRPVGTIDGVAVNAAELDLQLDLARRQGASDAEARSTALAAIAHDHALVSLAREAGVTSLASPAQILDARDGANEAKQAMAASGQVVYGKTTYSAAEFYSRTLTDLRTKLVRALSGGSDPRLSVNDAEVSDYLSVHLADWSAGATTFGVTALTVPAAADGSAPAALTTAAAQTTAGPRPSLEQVGKVLPGATLAAAVYDPAGLEAAGLSPDVKQQLQDAAVGATTQPFPQRGSWVVLRVDRRTVDTAAALAKHGDEIRAKLLDEAADRLIDERRARQTSDLR
jgi:hypothetical protein